jgi:signal transduction histidine kinase
LTLAFAGVMAVALFGLGAFILEQFRADLDGTLDQGLRSRADDVGGLVTEDAEEALDEESGARLDRGGANFAQILTATGSIVSASSGQDAAPLLSPAETRAAADGDRTVYEHPEDGEQPPMRVFAKRVRDDGETFVAVAGVSLETRNEALESLLALLLAGGGVALLVSSAAGYGLATAALRPIEAMRARAESIRGGSSGERLPVPAARDEVGALARTLNSMLERLEAAVERERSFVADASHDLRTPISILSAELELALRPDRSAEDLRAAVGSAGVEVDRLRRLADDLLVISRSDRGRLELDIEPVGAAELVERLRARFRPRADREGRVIGTAATHDLTVVADPHRLEQALGNLLENALRHGGGDIEIGARASNRDVEVWVEDRGAGFAEEFLPQAFDRFTRGAAGRSGEGSGLGLAIVAAICEAHGGRAEAQNTAGGGARVSLILPREGRDSSDENRVRSRAAG